MTDIEQLRENARSAVQACYQASLDMHPDNPGSVMRCRELLEEAKAALFAYDQAIKEL